MADGARFDINIQTQNLGADATSEQLNELAARITGVDVVATRFDTVVAATTKRLAEASSAAQVAAASLGEAQSRYAGLEREADRAAKALEKATAAGASAAKLDKLRSQAVSTAEAMQNQAAVVDALRAKSTAATSAQEKLAASLKTLETKQKGAADQIKKGGKAAESSSLDLAKFGKVGALAFVAMVAGAVGAVGAMGRFAISANPMAMMRLNLASQRLQFSMLKLFRGLDLSKFLGGMDRLGALFDTTNTSGRALKLLIETVMQPLFDAVGKLEPYVGEFFKGLIHGALQVYIAILKIEIAILKAMSPETRAAIRKMVDHVFTLENAFSLGTAVAITFAVIVGGVVLVALAACAIAALSLAAALSVVVVIAAGVAILVGLLLLPFVLLGAGIYELIDKWDDVTQWLSDTWDDFTTWAKKLAKGAKAWGADIIYGLTFGLAGGSVDLGAQIAATAKIIEGGLKKPLKINSPSKLAYEIGTFWNAGLVGGLEDGEGDVGDASASSAGAIAGGAAAGGSTSSTSTRTLHIEHLHIGDSPVAQSNLAAFRRACDEWIDGVSLTFGGGEVPSTP